MTDETRILLSDEVYIIYKKEFLEFVHEDTTTYPESISILTKDLTEGIVFDYELTKETVAWIEKTILSIDLVD